MWDDLAWLQITVAIAIAGWVLVHLVARAIL
jgi:hypothetical protein